MRDITRTGRAVSVRAGLGRAALALRELVVLAEHFGWPEQLPTETSDEYFARRRDELAAAEERVKQTRRALMKRLSAGGSEVPLRPSGMPAIDPPTRPRCRRCGGAQATHLALGHEFE